MENLTPFCLWADMPDNVNRIIVYLFVKPSGLWEVYAPSQMGEKFPNVIAFVVPTQPHTCLSLISMVYATTPGLALDPSAFYVPIPPKVCAVCGPYETNIPISPETVCAECHKELSK